MKIFSSLAECKKVFKDGVVVAIGKFDGVHRGHARVLKSAKKCPEAFLPVGVISFDPYPAEVLYPKETHYRLTCKNQKQDLLSRFELDFVCFLTVDKTFLQTSHHSFADMLFNDIKAKKVVVGEDFTFGKGALGNVDFLKKFSSSQHVLPVEQLFINGQKCSSSAIKNFLFEADLKNAKTMLGRHFSYRGMVERGQQKGRMFGFSTANLKYKNSPLKNGVYASVTRVFFSEYSKDFFSITNIGKRPTVSHLDDVVLETHLIDQEIDLYGHQIEVFFMEKIRDEIKFSSIKLLQDQVHADVEKLRGLLADHKEHFVLKE